MRSSRLPPRRALHLLYSWLCWADTLLGMNLPFDLGILRSFHPLLARALSGRHLLIDLSVVNFLQSDARPERSLKTLGPILGTHTYRLTARNHRFTSSPSLLAYCGADTHNTVLAISHLSRLITQESGLRPEEAGVGPQLSSSKLSPTCLSFYSSTIQCVTEMTEAGVPFSRSSLESLATSCRSTIARCESLAASWSPPLLLSGEGSVKSKATFLDLLTSTIDHGDPTSCPPDPVSSAAKTEPAPSSCASGPAPDSGNAPAATPPNGRLANSTPSIQSLPEEPQTPMPLALSPHTEIPCPSPAPPLNPADSGTPGSCGPLVSSPASFAAPALATSGLSTTSCLDHPLLQFTEKKRALSFNKANLSLLSSLLPESHPLRAKCFLIREHTHASKLLGTYLTPLLYHRANDPTDRTSILVPQRALRCPPPLPPSPPTTEPTSPPSSEPPTPTTSPSSRPSASPTPSPSPSSAPCPPSEATPKGSASFPSPSSSTPPTATPSTSSTIPQPGDLNPDTWLSHPSWFVVPSAIKDTSATSGGTLQSRITCKKGSHQTDPPEIQSCWSSRWVGGFLLSLDLKQAEIAAAGLLSGEPFFTNAFTLGHDLHSRQALRIWGSPELLLRYPALASHPIDAWSSLSSPFKKRERQVGKRVNFSHLFRAGADKMQASVLSDIGEILPLSIFHRIVSTRATELPYLWDWQESLIAEARSTGRVTLPLLGQSRSFLQGTSYDINEIVNFPVQSTAANALLSIQHYIQAALRSRPHPSIYCFLNIYDALKFDCRTQDDVTFLTSLIAEAMNHLLTRGYWSQLCDLLGRTVPLSYELEVHPC